jgi:hypothetical protein
LKNAIVGGLKKTGGQPNVYLLASGYVSLVKIDRDVETYVEWHRSTLCRPRGTREGAEEEALQYAFRLVDRRPFDGPPPGMPVAA